MRCYPLSVMHVSTVAIVTLCLLTGLTQSSQPYIVFILADDLGWNDVGFHGSDIKTPYIDRLAYEGVILNNYYVSPICTPTRGALMTGRYPIHLGLQHYVIAAPEPWGLPLNFTTMGQRFKTLGYSTHVIGKWHLGFFRKEYLPTNRGFDSHFGYWTGHEDYYTKIGDDRFMGLDFRRNLAVVNKTGYATEMYTEEAINVINSHDMSKPLFLYLAHQAPHAGNGYDLLEVPQKYVDRFPYIQNKYRRTYAGMMAALDDSIGAVEAALRSRGMLNNTIIAFSADNGAPIHYSGNGGCNQPLRGSKETLFEGGVHAAGFVHSPLIHKRRVKSDSLMHVTDWLPTLYSAAGGRVADLGPLDGHDMWDMLKTDGPSVRTELLHNIDPKDKTAAIRVGDYKLIKGEIYGGHYNGWYVCTDPELTRNDTKNEFGSLKYRRTKRHEPFTPYNVDCGQPPSNYTTNCQPQKSPCLFNIKLDPCEYNNIADTHQSIVADLLKRLDNYAKTAVPPVNTPTDPSANPIYHGGVWVPWMDIK